MTGLPARGREYFCIRLHHLFGSLARLPKRGGAYVALWSGLFSFRSLLQPFPPCLQNFLLQTVFLPVTALLLHSIELSFPLNQRSSSPPCKLVFKTWFLSPPPPPHVYNFFSFFFPPSILYFLPEKAVDAIPEK